VLTASVSVDEVVVGDLDRPGLLVLLGVTHTDTPDIARAMAGKLHELRILRDEQSCASAAAPLLVVSQFTLYGSTKGPPAVLDPGRARSHRRAADRRDGRRTPPARRRGRYRHFRSDDAGPERQRRTIHPDRRPLTD